MVSPRMVVSQGRLPSGALDASSPMRDFSQIRSDADERDYRDGGIADLRRQTGDVVEDGIRRRIEHLVLVEGLEPESFVFD